MLTWLAWKFSLSVSYTLCGHRQKVNPTFYVALESVCAGNGGVTHCILRGAEIVGPAAVFCDGTCGRNSPRQVSSGRLKISGCHGEIQPEPSEQQSDW